MAIASEATSALAAALVPPPLLLDYVCCRCLLPLVPPLSSPLPGLVARHATASSLTVVAPRLLSVLLGLLRGHGMPQLSPHAPEAVTLRRAAYSALDWLQRAAPAVTRSESSLPAELFAALRTEHARVREPLAALYAVAQSN